jgi:hypothetical protein
MKELSMNVLTDRIRKNKVEVDREILRTRTGQRLVRRRPRDPDEQKILDILCMARWEKAVNEGKVKYISQREWYYEFID